MCGISAIVGSPDSWQDGKALLAMHRALSHRGPDGEGFLLCNQSLQPFSFSGAPDATQFANIKPAFACAFHWLKILDLGCGAGQPMASRDGFVWVLFNGEIYNFRKLAEELVSHGHRFETGVDTEVIVAAYREWGNDCFRRFHGMWAILIVDLKRGVVVGSRDRIGIKPLFYSFDCGRLLLASEARAVALARRDGPRADLTRFREFLVGLPPQSADRTFFEEVYPVPAGSFFEVSLLEQINGPLQCTEFWRLSDFCHDQEHRMGEGEAASNLDLLLRSAVQCHSNAAVGLGALLSGGLDSSLLCSLLLKVAPLSKTFSLVYDNPAMSEWPYVQLVAAKCGGINHTLRFSRELAWNSVDRVVEAVGRPLLGQDIIAQYHVYKMARQHGATVVIDGQGADEILGGLPIYEAQMYLAMLKQWQLLGILKEMQLRSRRYGNSILSNLRSYFGPPLRAVSGRRQKAYNWISADWKLQDSKNCNGGPDASSFNRFLYRQVKHQNLPTVIEQLDHTSMRHGVEARVPYLDHRVVELCFQLPDHFKVANGCRKKVLHEVARPYLPSSVLNRMDKKMFVSDTRWMRLREHYRDNLLEMAKSTAMRQSGLFDAKHLQSFVEGYLLNRHDDELAVWRLYTAYRWIEVCKL